MNGKLASVKFERAKYIVTDWLTTNLAFLIFNLARYCILYHPDFAIDSGRSYIFTSKLIIEQIVIPFAMLGIYWLSGYYNRPFNKSRLQELVTTVFSSLIGTAIIYLALLTNDQITQRSTNWLLILVLFVCLAGCTYAGRAAVTFTSLAKFRKNQWGIRTVIVGNSERARRIAETLGHSARKLGFDVEGFAEIPGETTQPGCEKDAIPLESLKHFVRTHHIDQLIIVPAEQDEEKILHLLYSLFPVCDAIKIAPGELSFATSAIRLQDIYGEPFIDITSPAISESSKNVKRLGDIVVSALALLMLAPLFAALAIWIKSDSEGPVFYSQERIGYRRRPFRIYKFRSMRTDAEAAGPQLSSENDPRITRVGNVMRKYRLDELPQFWNVLKGDMSLVGPRPERAFFISQIVEKAPHYGLVHQVRPGITSWGMVKYGYASTVDEMVTRARYDMIYLSNMSVAVDMKILIHTVKTVITGKGV